MTMLFMADVTVLEDESLFQRLYETAPEDRKAKIDALRFPEDRRLSLGAWLLLEKTLRFRGVPEEILLSRNEYGKPFLKNRPDIHFSLSHSGTRVLCALSGEEVGCDIQIRKPGREAVARRFFTPEENAYLASQDSPEAFFRLWCLKESFLKAVGMGLALPMQEFSLVMEAGEIRIRQNRFPERQFFFRCDCDGDYCLACCAGNPEIPAPERLSLI